MTATLWLALLTVLLFGPAGPLLSGVGWVQRAPRAGVFLWQAIGIAGALAAIGFGVSVTVLPSGLGLEGGVRLLVHQATMGRPLQGLGIMGALGLTLAFDVCAVLVVGLLLTVVHTAVDRSRHRNLLDLVGNPAEGTPEVHVLDDPRVAAYCLPGFRPRIVVSSGTVRLLGHHQLGAVLAHEQGHAEGRHGAIMLPFASMDPLLGWLPYARHARTQVALLLEMAADDFALRTAGAIDLAAALVEMSATGLVPPCAFALGSTGVASRIHRLLGGDGPSTGTAFILAGVGAAVMALPLTALV
jgi:Zn-dependent protease with chaperone function